jgi:hypothetical protein
MASGSPQGNFKKTTSNFGPSHSGRLTEPRALDRGSAWSSIKIRTKIEPGFGLIFFKNGTRDDLINATGLTGDGGT